MIVDVFHDSPVTSHYSLSVAVAPGHYGQLLNVWERPRGIYPVSMAMLELLLTMTTSSDTTDNQLACVVFVMREMFAGYHKWRYRSVSHREEIGIWIGCVSVWSEVELAKLIIIIL